MENNYFTGNNTQPDLKSAQKESLRRNVMFIGIAMLIASSIGIFFAPIYLNIAALFGISGNDAAAFVNNPFGNELMNQLLSVIMFTLPFFVILSGCSLKFSEAVSLKAPSGKMLLPMVLLGIAFCGFANVVSNLMFEILASFGIEFQSMGYEQPSGKLGFIISLVGSVLIAPLCEELAMRGIILGSLRKYSARFAIFASAVLFGLVHGRIQQIPFAFVVGLALGFAVIKSGSLWTGVIIHAVNNLSASLLTAASEKLSAEASAFINIGYLAACLFCGFIAILLLNKEDKEEELLPHGEDLLKVGEATGVFFSSPFIIIYMVITLITVFSRL